MPTCVGVGSPPVMAQPNNYMKPVGSDTRFGAVTRVRGRIDGDGNLVVEGAVEGNISLRGDLQLAVGSEVTADIEAQDVDIEGTLDGDVSASGQVHLGPGSRVRGALRASAIIIDDGARFAGRLECDFDMPAELEERRR